MNDHTPTSIFAKEEKAMSYEEKIIKSTDGYNLNLHVYDVPAPKAVIMCIHGMEEHKERYIPFAIFLQEHGFAVVTADLRGHGKSAPLLSHIADKDGARLLIEDEKIILASVKEKYPESPVYLFGHSMGTIIARKLLQTDSRAFSKVVLSGYPNPQAAARIGAMLNGIIMKIKGPKGHSGMIDGMVLGGVSKAVKDAASPLDWLSVNRENIKTYAEDPLCGAPFTLGSYDALFHLLMNIDRPDLYRDVNKTLPILLIAGSGDPCVGGEKGKADSLDRLKRAGFQMIHGKTLEGMRHEILEEQDRGAVAKVVVDFSTAP